MSRYIGCETARELLDGFLDEELGVEEQVMVESHLRWCRTCACRVEDMRLIGSALRDGSAPMQIMDTDLEAVSSIQASVLLRVCTEREQSVAVRLKDMFSDMRLFWPALGGTTALAICITAAYLVLHWSTELRSESLAAMIATSEPGTEGNPLLPTSSVRSVDDGLSRYVEENRLSVGISMPRSLDDGGVFEGVHRAAETGGLGDNAIFALQAVVTRDGRIASYRVISEGGRGQGVHLERMDAVLADAMRHSRFVPAQTPGGSKVAVNMVWLIMSATAVMPPPDAVVRAPMPDRVVVPAVAPEAEGARRPSKLPLSTTA